MNTIDSLFDALRHEISGTRAVDTSATVARYNRVVGSSDYAAAVAMLAGQLRTYAGLDEVTVESFAIDGQRTYTGRVFGPAWEPHSARLAVVHPETYVICDFAETPMCLPSGCPATPAAGVTADVIDVGRGDRLEHYAGVDVAGRAVLASGLTTDVYNLAVEQYGAACVLTTNMYDWSNLPERKRSMLDLPDATHLARLYHDAEKKRPAPVFSITYRHAERLRAQMRQGPVSVHATVHAETKPGELLVLTAAIQGADLAQEEVWILAHLCHPKPGACDNGSGVALGMELFRSMGNLIQRGELPRPRRTLRLLLLPEMSGTQAYIDRHRTRMGDVKAGINLDMVGASYAATGAYCRLVTTPWSRPSFLTHLGAYLLEKASLGARSHIRPQAVRDWLYAVAPYDKGSDHDVLLNSIFAIPSVFFFYWPHRYYHTDFDTPEKLDPAEFQRTGAVAGTMALAVAAMSAEVAGGLLDLLDAEAGRALAAQQQGWLPAPDWPSDADTAAIGRDRLWALAVTEQGALASVVDALPAGERAPLAGKLARLQRSLADVTAGAAPPHDDPQAAAGQVVPLRSDPWPVDLGRAEKEVPDGRERLKALRDAVVDFDDKAVAAVNYADGKRTVFEVAHLVTGELGPCEVSQVAELFALLSDAGIISINHA